MAKSKADRQITYNLLAKYDPRSDKAFDAAEKKFKSLRDLATVDLAAVNRFSNGAASAASVAAASSASARDKTAPARSAAGGALFAGQTLAYWNAVAEKMDRDLAKAHAAADNLFNGRSLGYWGKISSEIDRDLKQKQTAADKIFAGHGLGYWSKISASIDSDLTRKQKAADNLFNGRTLSHWAGVSREIDRDLARKKTAADKLFAGQTLGYWSKVSSQMDRDIKNLAREKARADRDAERAVVRLARSQDDLNNKVLGGAKNALQLAKGWAEIHAASIPGLEKMVSALAAIQGGFDLVKGGIESYQTLVEIVKSYRRAVELATAAETAASAVRKGAAASEAVSLGGAGAASVAAAGGGGAASVAAAGAPVAAQATAVVGSLALVALGAKLVYDAFVPLAEQQSGLSSKINDAIDGPAADWGSALASLTSAMGLSETSVIKGYLGVYDAANKSAHSLDVLKSASEAAAEQRTRERAAETGAVAAFADAESDSLRRKFEQQNIDVANRNGGDMDDAKGWTYMSQRRELLNALTEHKSNLAAFSNLNDPKGVNEGATLREKQQIRSLQDQIVALDREQEQIVLRTGKTAVDSLTQQLEMHDQLVEKARQGVQTAQGSLQGAQARFADLTLPEQASFARVQKKLAAGEDLRKDEADLYGRVMGGDDKVTANRARQGALAAKRGGVNFDELEERVASAKKQEAAAIQAKIETQNKFKVAINFAPEAMKKIEKMMRPLINEIESKVEAEVEALRKEVKGKIRQRAAQGAAGARG